MSVLDLFKKKSQESGESPANNYRKKLNRVLQEGRNTPGLPSLMQRKAIKSTLDLFKKD